MFFIYGVPASRMKAETGLIPAGKPARDHRSPGYKENASTTIRSGTGGWSARDRPPTQFLKTHDSIPIQFIG